MTNDEHFAARVRVDTAAIDREEVAEPVAAPVWFFISGFRRYSHRCPLDPFSSFSRPGPCTIFPRPHTRMVQRGPECRSRCHVVGRAVRRHLARRLRRRVITASNNRLVASSVQPQPSKMGACEKLLIATETKSGASSPRRNEYRRKLFEALGEIAELWSNGVSLPQ